MIAEIPGESSQDYLLLMAPYDSRAIPGIRFVGVNDGASGAAVLLEIARVIGRKPLHYTLRLLFTDGDVDPDGTLSLRGSRAYAAGSKADGSLARTRLAVQVNRVCDTDLHIARDLLSHRQYRESFWDAALRLGLRSLRAGELRISKGRSSRAARAGLHPGRLTAGHELRRRRGARRLREQRAR